jgi:hypothetical protein
MGDALSTENLANLMSWPAAFLAFVYAAMTIGRWAVGLERLPHAMASALIAVAASGFLLRPLDALGMVENGARDTIALVIRTLFLIVMLGLVWHLIDRWHDRRRARRD